MFLPRLAGGALALLGAAGPLLADQVPVYLGDPAAAGALRSFDAATGALLPADPALEGLILLPIELNGRLASQQLLPGCPRLHEDLPGLGRIHLPGDGGMLMRFRRDLPMGGATFGFLRVAGDGTIQLLGERQGAGPAGTIDPYRKRVAVSADGTRALASTVPAAGGDVIDLDLASGQAHDRSAHLPPLEWRPASLRVGAGWLVAVESGGVWRSGLAAGEGLQAVALEGAPTHFTGELVLSPDGSHALTTAGSGPEALHAHALGAQGTARRVTRDAGRLSGAGYLPDAVHGPFLAVSDDGQHGAWRELPAVPGGARELFVRGAAAAPTNPAVHVTSDAVILDTLDEVGVLTMAQPGTVVVAIGEQAAAVEGGIASADLYSVDLATGAMVNLTGTSGDLAAPFEVKGQLTLPFRRELPGGAGQVLHHDPGSGEGKLLQTVPGGGLRLLRVGVKEVGFVERAADRVVAAVRRLDTGGWEILAWPADLSGPVQVVLDLGSEDPTGMTAGPGGRVAVTAGGRLYRLEAGASQAQLFPAVVQQIGAVLGWTQGGGLLFSLSRGQVTGFAIWPPAGAPRRLRAIAPQGTLLPAR